MKKLIALLLVAVMLLATLAGCTGGKPEETEAPTEAVTEPEVQVPGSALEILENVWALYGEEEKFPVMGGDMNNLVDGAPGKYDVADAEGLGYYFYLNADQIGQVDDAASILHAMMLNNFTCGAFHVTGDAQTFAADLKERLMNNQWICGMPETLVISVVGGEYVVMAFGINDAMVPFETKLYEAYPAAERICSEPIV